MGTSSHLVLNGFQISKLFTYYRTQEYHFPNSIFLAYMRRQEAAGNGELGRRKMIINLHDSYSCPKDGVPSH